jgi:hypothetical protein
VDEGEWNEITNASRCKLFAASFSSTLWILPEKIIDLPRLKINKDTPEVRKISVQLFLIFASCLKTYK